MPVEPIPLYYRPIRSHLRPQLLLSRHLLLHSFDIFLVPPLTDVEYADDTILIARTHDTLSRLLHLQHLAARIGLLLNGAKCQLICIHTNMPVSLSCPFCAPFFQSPVNPDALGTPSPSSPLPTTLARSLHLLYILLCSRCQLQMFPSLFSL